MTDALKFTLLGDGSSDRALLRPLRWLLELVINSRPIDDSWADFSSFAKRPKGLPERIAAALDSYPCDLLFVHRDAEGQSPESRYDEIISASIDHPGKPIVCVVPIWMTEAWLLFDESAIRRAAGKPNSKIQLDLPKLTDLEALPKPKKFLQDLLIKARGLSVRQSKSFSTSGVTRRVADYINDFSPLRVLTAFARLETELSAIVHARGWHLPP